MARTKNRGLVYLRRSTTKQEISLAKQLEWACDEAKRHDVRLDASNVDLELMQTRRLHSFKDIRLDDGISGSDMTRPGFRAFIQDSENNRAVSHVFFYKRDRFARSDDALEATRLEKNLRTRGITVVHSDGIGKPIRRGEQNILSDLEPLLAYSQGGEEVRKLAECILVAQKDLARRGYRVGGNAPYGFVRVLVDDTGSILEELPRGKTVRQPGCHVRVVPKDPEKILIWLRILKLREQGWGFKRIAVALNEMGIPSPDAGRTRTDQGVQHFVGGKWSHSTVAELCRNPIITGVQEYGKRSEGKLRRLDDNGARLLEDEKDISPHGQPRTVINDPSLRIRTTVGEEKYDRERWQQLQSRSDARSRNQKGIPRTKDPTRYPLACRIVDLTNGCGSILYGHMNGDRALYTCGRYMRTAGAECASNQVDAEAMLRFTLKTLGQMVWIHGSRDKLRAKLFERALRGAGSLETYDRKLESEGWESRRKELEEQLSTIKYRMARERDDTLYQVLVREFHTTKAALAKLNETIR